MRFPGFSDEWEKTTLGNIAQVVKDKISTSALQSNNYISTENILPNFGGVIDNCNIPDNQNVTNYTIGDILLANIRPYLKKIWLADRCGGCNADVLVFRPNYNSSFVYYSIANDKFCDYVMIGAKGVKMPRGDKEQILKFEISIPSEKEQQKIVRLLSLIDERIATQNKIIDNLQSLIKGLNDSFHDGVQGTPISFDQIGNSYSGLSGKSGDDFGQGRPFITYLNVYQNNIVNEKQIDLVSVDANDSQNTISYGDVLFTLSSETPEETGLGCVYLGASGKYFLNSFCFGITITQPDKVYPPYLAYLVSSSKFRKFVYPLAQGSTRFNLQKKDFMKKKFTLLPVERQKEISTVLDTLNNRLSVECKLVELYRKQKDYLLRNIFI